MKTLELIHLRWAGESPGSLAQLIRRAAAESPAPLDITVYRNATLTTDLTIHLLWLHPEDRGAMSTAGLALASVLREYGMVDHSIWVEVEEGDGEEKEDGFTRAE